MFSVSLCHAVLESAGMASAMGGWVEARQKAGK